MLAGGIWRDHRLGAALGKPVPQTSGIIGSVGNQVLRDADKAEQIPCTDKIMDVSGCDGKGDGAAVIVGQSVDFRGAATARSADGIVESPPFPPDAERCTLMWVLSADMPVTTPVDPVSR